MQDRENEELYTENILDKSKDYSFDLKLSDNVRDYVCGKGTNPSCGDMGDMYFLIEGNKVKDIRLKKEGCAISLASMVMLSEKLIGKSLEDVKSLTPGDIYNMLGVKISPSRSGCALLSYNALEDFLKNRK